MSCTIPIRIFHVRPAFLYFLHDPKRVMCYGRPLRASWNQCQAMLSNAHQCKAIQPFPHVFCELSRRIYAFLLHWFFRKITRECCQAFRSLLAYRYIYIYVYISKWASPRPPRPASRLACRLLQAFSFTFDLFASIRCVGKFCRQVSLLFKLISRTA